MAKGSLVMGVVPLMAVGSPRVGLTESFAVDVRILRSNAWVQDQ